MSMRTLKITVFFAALISLAFSAASAFAQPDKCPCDCPASYSKASKSGAWATLSVDSNPKGAEVYVDSEYQGTTPLQNAQVPAGNVPVTLVKEGFQRQTTRVSLKSGEAKALGVIQLGDAYGEITIHTYPARATVLLDGEKINARTPVVIRRVPRDKPHTIQLQMEGFNQWERIVTLDDKDKKKYDVELQHKP
ncbi:MAG TPA: PEGA domain-containing protein [bacterium]|nr:PEGA domain-containing protein [bacterium]